jgi:hypothetical protein
MVGEEPDEPTSVTRETDAIARVHFGTNLHNVVDGDVPNMSPLFMGLTGVIEAKSLRPTEAFVGFMYKAPADRRSLRMRFAGAPSNWILPQHSEAQIAGELAVALDPINDAPYCIQWAVAERAEKSGKPELRASHPPRWAAGLVNLVRGIHLLAVENTKHLLSFTGQPQGARVDFYEPTLFIKTPNLHLFDVTTRTLTTTPRLTLAIMFELSDGERQTRLVDVWTGGAVKDFASRYRAVRKNFEEMAQPMGVKLVRAALQQRKRYQSEGKITAPSLPEL